MDKVYKMKLHDTLIPAFGGRIIRVPGGWVYESYSNDGDGGYNVTSCFVPYTLNDSSTRRHDDKELPAFLRRQAD